MSTATEPLAAEVAADTITAVSIDEHLAWARARVARTLELGGRERPADAERVVAVLVSSLDGVLALEGKSAALSSDQDRALVGAWRERADALLVGPPTLAAELYGGGLFSAQARAMRIAAGAPPLAPIVTIDRSGSLDVERAMRAREPLELVAYVPLGAAAADPRVQWIEHPDLSLQGVLRDLRERFGHRLIVAEPGPTLMSALLEEWQLTDLSLTITPVFGEHGPRLDTPSGAQPLTVVDVETVGEVIFVHMVAGRGSSTV